MQLKCKPIGMINLNTAIRIDEAPLLFHASIAHNSPKPNETEEPAGIYTNYIQNFTILLGTGSANALAVLLTLHECFVKSNKAPSTLPAHLKNLQFGYSLNKAYHPKMASQFESIVSGTVTGILNSAWWGQQQLPQHRLYKCHNLYRTKRLSLFTLYFILFMGLLCKKV